MAEREQRCENCRFWDLYDVTVGCGAFGECHRNPPPPYYEDDKPEPVDIGRWPSTWHNDWCGEWQPAADESRP